MSCLHSRLSSVDLDNDGFITVEECRTALQSGLNKEEETIETLVKIAGFREGKISIDDFCR